MPVLELGVDARGIRQGLTDADRALDQTAKKAQQAESSVKRMGTTAQASGHNLSAAFAATGGGLSVTRGLVSIGDGFKSANLGMATFAASQALLDIGRLSADMAAVSSATGAAGGAFSKLGAIIKANPLLTIATILAGAATAMGLFGKETKETADEWDRLGKAIKDARLGSQVKDFLGISNNRGGELSSLESLVGGYLKQPAYGTTSISDLRKQAGLTQPQVESAAFRGGAFVNFDPSQGSAQKITNTAAAAILRQIYKDISAQVTASSGSAPGSSVAFGGGLFGSQFGGSPNFYPGPRNAQDIENQRIAQFRQTQRQGGSLVFGQGALGPNQFDVNFGGPSTAGDLIRQSPAERAQIDAAIRNRNIEEAQRAMDELVQTGREFGATIGDAFFNVASGTQSARQALASLVLDFSRAASRQTFANIFGAASAGFGKTGAQVAADTPPPGGSNIQLRPQ